MPVWAAPMTLHCDQRAHLANGVTLTPNDATHNALAVSHIFVTTFPANAR